MNQKHYWHFRPNCFFIKFIPTLLCIILTDRERVTIHNPHIFPHRLLHRKLCTPYSITCLLSLPPPNYCTLQQSLSPQRPATCAAAPHAPTHASAPPSPHPFLPSHPISPPQLLPESHSRPTQLTIRPTDYLVLAFVYLIPPLLAQHNALTQPDTLPAIHWYQFFTLIDIYPPPSPFPSNLLQPLPLHRHIIVGIPDPRSTLPCCTAPRRSVPRSNPVIRIWLP